MFATCLVKDDPRDVGEHGAPSVRHASENLCCHDEAVGVWRDDNVAGHEPDVAELLLKLSELLVAESLRGHPGWFASGCVKRAVGVT